MDELTARYTVVEGAAAPGTKRETRTRDAQAQTVSVRVKEIGTSTAEVKPRVNLNELDGSTTATPLEMSTSVRSTARTTWRR